MASTGRDPHETSDFFSSYFQTYIEKDIKDVLRIKDESAFIKFVKAAASYRKCVDFACASDLRSYCPEKDLNPIVQKRLFRGSGPPVNPKTR